MGARYIYRQDFRENAIGGLRGGGPELVYFFGNYRDPVRPFVSAGFLRTQAINRWTGQRLEDGATVSLTGGLNIAMSNSVACCRPDTFSDRMSSPPGEAPSIMGARPPRGCSGRSSSSTPPAERRHIQIRAVPVLGCLNWCGGTKSASGQPPRYPGSGTRCGNGFPLRCTVTRCNQALLAAHSTAFSISRRKSSSQKSFWCPSEV